MRNSKLFISQKRTLLSTFIFLGKDVEGWERSKENSLPLWPVVEASECCS